MKLVPRIKKVRRFYFLKRWQCRGAGIIGYGKTPWLAYYDWATSEGHMYFSTIEQPTND